MKILGYVRARNSERTLKNTLDLMQSYCDAIFVFDDRSTDSTRSIALKHPAVMNLFSADARLSQEPWFFSEAWVFNFFYRMADFYCPDWIIPLDDDQFIEPSGSVRDELSAIDPSVSGLRLPLISLWDDPLYPRLVPLMGTACSQNGAIWRYYPGLEATTQRLHGSKFPVNLEVHGTIASLETLTIYHSGWSTLQKRIARVNFYTSVDPTYEMNGGVPYDRALLFGYSRDAVDHLLRDYHEKLHRESSNT